MVNIAGFYVNPYRIPIIGGTIYNVGQVYDIMIQPCGVDTYISVLAFFQYLPRLAWSIYKPTPLDTYTEMLSRRKKRRRGRRYRVDLLENPVDVGKKGSVRWVTWKIFAATERWGWYFIVLDSTVDFLVNWSSMAYTFTGCAVAGTPSCQARNTITRQYFTTGIPVQVVFDQWGPGTIWSSNQANLNCFTHGPKMAIGGVTPIMPTQGPEAAPQWMELTKSTPGLPNETARQDIDSDDPAEWGTAELMRSFSDIDRPCSYHMLLKHSFGWAAYENAYMSASGTLDDGFKWDP